MSANFSAGISNRKELHCSIRTMRRTRRQPSNGMAAERHGSSQQMEVHLDQRGAYQQSTAPLGRTETPFLDGFDRFFVEAEARRLDYLEVMCTAVRAHFDHQHNDALNPRLTCLLGELGLDAVNHLGLFRRDSESA